MSDQVSAPGTTQPPAEKPQGNAISRWWKGQSTFGKIRTVVIALVIVVVAPIAYFASQSQPSAAEVGDCMAGQDEDSLKVVECTDPTAEWEVVGRIETADSGQTTEVACAAYPQADASYWQESSRGSGFTLCLASK